VVGHIFFSRVTIDNAPAAFNGVGLAPVVVLPKFHRQGIGSKLIRDGLERCKQAGYDAVVLIGYPAYTPASVLCEPPTSVYRMNTTFMMSLGVALRDGALKGVSGMVKYLPEFREAEC